MALIALGAAAIGAYGAQQQRTAASRASDAQQQAEERAQALQGKQYQMTREELAPWMTAGRGALAEQQSLMGLGGDTGAAMRSLQRSPGYQFKKQQGLRNLEGGLSARGGMGSGRSMAAGQRYAQDFASGEYGNRLSQLSNLSGMGQTTAGNLGQFGSQYGARMSDLMTGSANAYGAGQFAQARANQEGLLGAAQLGLAGYSAMNKPRNTWQTDYSIPMTTSGRP